MRSHCHLRYTFLLLFILISACSKEPKTTEQPTLSSEDVIRTAEAIAEKSRQAATPTPCSTPITPTATAIPETATPEPTATLGKPIVQANYNANVRSGPDETYDVLDVFFEGQKAEVIGQYVHPQLGAWWFIKRIGEGLNGWVWGGAVTISGDTSTIPYLQPPPTSTATKPPTTPPSPSETPSPTATSAGG